jgi:hypothetical protein
VRRRREEPTDDQADDVIDLTLLEHVGVTEDAPFVDRLRRWTREGRVEEPVEEPAPDPWRTPSSWPISRQIGR